MKYLILFLVFALFLGCDQIVTIDGKNEKDIKFQFVDITNMTTDDQMIRVNNATVEIKIDNNFHVLRDATENMTVEYLGVIYTVNPSGNYVQMILTFSGIITK